jgi:catechol 2,3-dioxygenase-like lactoylglutathione lyase family enzyme
MLAGRNIRATIAVSDIERARSFYEETLGMQPPRELADGNVLYESGGSSFVVYASPSAGTSQVTVAAWEVDDAEAEVSELRSKGISFEEYDFPGLKTENGIATMGSIRGAWFKDPDGNILGVYQEG